MKKSTIGYISFGVCCVILAGFSIFLTTKLTDYQEHISDQGIKLGQQSNSIGNLEGIIDKYQIENELLVDSILILNESINDYILRIDEQDKIIATLERKLNKSLRKFQSLEREISVLEQEKIDNSVLIASIEAEKNRVLQEYSETKVQADMQVETKTKLEQAAAENIEMVVAEQKRMVIDEIVQNTTVDFSSVKIGKKPGRKNTRKIEGKNKWNYTTFEFSMAHGFDNTKIMDEQFILKIVDTNTGEVLPYNESNVQFPDESEGTTGATFRFVDNPVSVLHVNLQPKTGKNYEARIYLVREGKEYLLANSHRTLVKNGKALN